MTKKIKQIDQLKEYFQQRSDICMAFLFGSQASGNTRTSSDWDIGIYFYPTQKEAEWETGGFYPAEDKIWGELTQLLSCEVDLAVLNRAPASLAFSIITDGVVLLIKDQGIYLDFMLRISYEAQDFREFIYDYWKIKQKAASLTSQARERLIRILDFLETECQDFPQFKRLSWIDYRQNRSKQREVERWVENIVNASLDIAKILLASAKKPIAQTYREIMQNLALLDTFDISLANELANWVKSRNILAHQYLDLRWEQIKKFIDQGDSSYNTLIDKVKSILTE